MCLTSFALKAGSKWAEKADGAPLGMATGRWPADWDSSKGRVAEGILGTV